MGVRGLRLFSWNVNGIRAAVRKGFLDWLDAERPDVLCLQEIRANRDQVGPEVLQDHGYHVTWVSAERKGYSGVATFSRHPPDEVVVGLGDEQFDREGRLVMTRHGDLVVYNGYFPNGQRDHARVPYKLAFYERLLAVATERVEQGERVILCGDWNTAHQPIDLARPRANVKTTGFLPHERAMIDTYIDVGFVDAFRVLYPLARDRFTLWSNRAGARDRNIGWRIDYHMVHRTLLPRVVDARIHDHVLGSDHCPVELELVASPGDNEVQP